MSTKRLEHLKDGEKIYTPLERILHLRDDTDGLCFHNVNGCISWVTDDDTFYAIDDLKQLANDGMPKQGEMIEARYKTWVEGKYIKGKFICMYGGFVLVDDNDLDAPDIHCYTEWRYPKTELTLAQVEEKLGLEKDSLIIKD